MMDRGKIKAVFRNEWQQTFTAGGMTGWLLLCLFPVLLTTLVSRVGRIDPEATEAWTMILFPVCEIICLLQLLLWATPWLSSELEAGNWIYLSVRPGGKTAVLLGKYLAAATRTMIGTTIGLLLALLVAKPEDGVYLFLVLGTLIAISSFSYAAVFTFLGTLFPRRAMVMAVGYSLLIELAVSFIPAVINQVSIQFRLRSMLFTWMDFLQVQGSWRPPPGFEDMLGNSSVLLHLGVLLCMNVGLLWIGSQLICRREQVSKVEV
jgi:ABC-type transport system involved in multi-copper enzyme maturation permease subunit